MLETSALISRGDTWDMVVESGPRAARFLEIGKAQLPENQETRDAIRKFQEIARKRSGMPIRERQAF